MTLQKNIFQIDNFQKLCKKLVLNSIMKARIYRSKRNYLSLTAIRFYFLRVLKKRVYCAIIFHRVFCIPYFITFFMCSIIMVFMAVINIPFSKGCIHRNMDNLCYHRIGKLLFWIYMLSNYYYLLQGSTLAIKGFVTLAKYF